MTGDTTRIRRLATYFLAGGLLVSIGLYAAFNLLLMTSHPPAPLQPGIGVSVSEWISAYAKWQNTNLAYSEASGLSFVAALAFVVALAVFLAPKRLAFYAAFVLLNVYFAWTSHLLYDISAPLDIWVGQAIGAQANFIWTTGSLGFFFPSFVVVTDLEPLILVGLLAVLAFLLNREVGAKRAVLLALQVAALSLVILGVEIGVFDQREFNLHVTQAQALLSFEPSFTNADLLYSAIALFAVSTFLLNLRRLRTRRY